MLVAWALHYIIFTCTCNVLGFFCSICNCTFDFKCKYERHLETTKHKQFALVFGEEEMYESCDDDDSAAVPKEANSIPRPDINDDYIDLSSGDETDNFSEVSFQFISHVLNLLA